MITQFHMMAAAALLIMSGLNLHAQPVFLDWYMRDNLSSSDPCWAAVAEPGGPSSWGDEPWNYNNSSGFPDGSPYTGYVFGTNPLFTAESAQQLPATIMLLPPTNPSTDTAGTLVNLVANVISLNYVMADFELQPDSTSPGYYPYSQMQVDMTDMVNDVRASTNSNVKNAYVGNYSITPGASDDSFWAPWSQDWSARNAVYVNSGVNVALPDCYAYAFMMEHTVSNFGNGLTPQWGTNISPNQRSGIFYGTLERFSYAKRNLPSGHKIIPLTQVFQPWQEYASAPIPPKADHLALIQHYRMRGADGILRFDVTDYNALDTNGSYLIPRNSWIMSYTEEQNRQDILNAWQVLNSSFGTQPTSFLNLTTTKTTGLEWSAVRYRNNVTALVSNLNATSSLTASYPAGWGLPSASASVAPNTHQTFTYTIANEMVNSGFNSGTTGWADLEGTSGWDSSNGVSGSGCLRLSGAYYAADYGYYWNPALCGTLCGTAGNAKMQVSLSAKGNNPGCQLTISFYTEDASGNVLSNFCVVSSQTVTTSHQTYTYLFTIPNDSRIAYISPILYDARYPTSSTDIVYVDNMAVNFQNNGLTNSGFDSGTTGWSDTLGTSGWDSSNGVLGGGCLRLSGAYYAADYGYPGSPTTLCATKANANMQLSLCAKGNNPGCQLTVSFYTENASGTVISSFNVVANQVITTGYKTYTFSFTVPNNSAISYISPILYDARYPTSSTDIVYIDNMELDFQ